MVVYGKKDGKQTYHLSGHLVPQVDPLFVDKLYITLEIPESLHPQVIAGFMKAKEQGIGMHATKTAYKYNLKLATDLLPDVLIQCSPQIPTHRFFRIEFTPSKANLSNLKKDIDNILPGGYEHLISAGIVTRIDLTVDVHYLDAADIIASNPKIKIQTHYAKNGLIESQYLGSSGSGKQTLLYDKGAQLKKVKKEVPSVKLLRIEHRFSSMNCTLKEVTALPNPFTDLVLVAYPGSKSPKVYDPRWTLFLSACRFEGVQIALKHFNIEDQKDMKKRLQNEGRTDWWKPDQVWQGLPNAIGYVTKVKGYNPPLPTIS